MDYPVAEARQNNSNGQKLLTIPKDSEISSGDKVRLVKLGKNWDKIPGYLKTHINIKNLINLTIKAGEGLELRELEEIDKHLEEAGEALSDALDLIEDEYQVYADISTEQLQEECRHDKIVRNGGGWQCVDCKKVIPLDL